MDLNHLIDEDVTKKLPPLESEASITAVESTDLTTAVESSSATVSKIYNIC